MREERLASISTKVYIWFSVRTLWCIEQIKAGGRSGL